MDINNKTFETIKTITISTVILLFLDFIFISIIINKYGKMIQNVQGSPLKANIYGGFICYIFIISSLYYFILRERRSIKDAFLLGFFIYGILETTNFALLKKWDPLIATIDIFWGGTLYAITTYLTFFFMK